jgi:hypothetical protein
MSLARPPEEAQHRSAQREGTPVNAAPGAPMWRRLLHGLSLCLLLALHPMAFAHKGSDAYLDVRGDEGAAGALALTLSVAVQDLDLVLPLDANADGKVTWGEIQAAHPAVEQLLQASTGLQGSAPCALEWRFAGLERRSDGAYQRWSARTGCPGAASLRYTLLAAQDATHRLLVTGRIDGQDLLSTWSPQQPGTLALRPGVTDGADGAALHSGPATLWSYLKLGMHHLLEGYDHLAFLLALVLPLQLALGRGGRLPALAAVRASWGAAASPSASASGSGSASPSAYGAPPGFASASVTAPAVFAPTTAPGFGSGPGFAPAPAFASAAVPMPPLALAPATASAPAPPSAWPSSAAASAVPLAATWWTLLRTVTAFTIGHSITLVLATLGWTQASPAWVEPVIALSIGVTALLNLFPVARVRSDVLALLFGLVHGYGFAGLLTEAAAPPGLLPWALGGFNLGVECGQLVAVAAWVLLSQAVVRQRWYGSVVVRGGSWLLVLLSAWWFWERVA